MAIPPTDIRILFTNYDIITYFLNLASSSEHFISIKHRILATFNIKKKINSDSLYAFNIMSTENFDYTLLSFFRKNALVYCILFVQFLVSELSQHPVVLYTFFFYYNMYKKIQSHIDSELCLIWLDFFYRRIMSNNDSVFSQPIADYNGTINYIQYLKQLM
jgi:hypothetical protein